jgi:hypothetical protein
MTYYVTLLFFKIEAIICQATWLMPIIPAGRQRARGWLFEASPGKKSERFHLKNKNKKK